MTTPNCNAQLWYDEGTDTLNGTITCMDATGRAYGPFSRAVALGPLREELAARLSARAPVGGFWGDVKAAASKLAAPLAKRRLLRQLRAIALSPAVAQGVGLASAIFPPLGVTYAAARAADAFVERVRAGDEQAQLGFMEIIERAKTGDPTALKTASVIGKLYLVKKRDPATATKVAGWLYETPYPSNIRALELDRKNPKHALRWLYHEGLNPDTPPDSIKGLYQLGIMGRHA